MLCISFLRLLPSFSNITAIRNSINFHRHDVLKFLEEIDNINDNDKTVKLLNFSDDIDSIELKNINFKYNDKSKFSLKNNRDQIILYEKIHVKNKSQTI